MATLKTSPNDKDVQTFLQNVEDEQKRAESFEILALMEDITGEKGKMWGGSIIGFGSYHYVYPTGREGDWFLTGFSPRKQNFSLYIMAGFGRHADLMEKLGKYKTGKSCLYVKRLSDIDREVLRELIAASVAHLREKYPSQD